MWEILIFKWFLLLKIQKTRFWKEKSVEDVVTLGPTQRPHIAILNNQSSLYRFACNSEWVRAGCYMNICCRMLQLTAHVTSNRFIFLAWLHRDNKSPNLHKAPQCLSTHHTLYPISFNQEVFLVCLWYLYHSHNIDIIFNKSCFFFPQNWLLTMPIFKKIFNIIIDHLPKIP